jgi:hypothetical protein
MRPSNGHSTTYGAKTFEENVIADVRFGNTNSASRGLNRGGRQIENVYATRPAQAQMKQGQSGRPVNLQANYFRVLKMPDFDLVSNYYVLFFATFLS